MDRMLLQEPHPALVLDRYWNVIKTNEAAPRFFGSFVGDSGLWAPTDGYVTRAGSRLRGARRRSPPRPFRITNNWAGNLLTKGCC
ncbi:MAG TPA: hypothetical protein VMU26_23960 [Candidatus Polarisedimenticolia bacterium]|nr:hypothetical protein [Candidatus Polarisedimenticolia bacterium]